MLTTPVGVRLALKMYASLTSFFAGVDELNCLCILASRCCGREAILKDVRRAKADISQIDEDTVQRSVETEEALASREVSFT